MTIFVSLRWEKWRHSGRTSYCFCILARLLDIGIWRYLDKLQNALCIFRLPFCMLLQVNPELERIDILAFSCEYSASVLSDAAQDLGKMQPTIFLVGPNRRFQHAETIYLHGVSRSSYVSDTVRYTRLRGGKRVDAIR